MLNLVNLKHTLKKVSRTWMHNNIQVYAYAPYQQWFSIKNWKKYYSMISMMMAAKIYSHDIQENIQYLIQQEMPYLKQWVFIFR